MSVGPRPVNIFFASTSPFQCERVVGRCAPRAVTGAPRSRQPRARDVATGRRNHARGVVAGGRVVRHPSHEHAVVRRAVRAQPRESPDRAESRRGLCVAGERQRVRPGSKKTQSVTSSKRNVPKKKVAWEDDSSDESPDEWEFAERGPLAKLRLKNQGETAKERAALGFYVDEAEYGDEYDFSDVTMWKKPIGNDPDFSGPESYPRRMRDSYGYYIWFLMFFASMVIGWNVIGNGEPEHMWHLRDNAGNLCGLGAMKQRPHLGHPFAHADPSSTKMHPGVGVCVDECPRAGAWVCVADSAQDGVKRGGAVGGC